MSVVVSCNCGKKFKAKPEMAGKKVRCPECKTVLRIPGGGDDSAVETAATAKAESRKAKTSPTKPAIDEESVLLKYEAVQKRKQMDAEAEAVFKAEQQKIIESYDQLAGKGSPADLAKKKKKDELALAGVPTKPTVATKAADAAGTVMGNSFVKYVLVIALLGAATYGSIQLVKMITQGVDRSITDVVSTADKVKALMNDARDAIAAKEFVKAKGMLDEILRLDPSKKDHRTFKNYLSQVEEGIGKKSKP